MRSVVSTAYLTRRSAPIQISHFGRYGSTAHCSIFRSPITIIDIGMILSNAANAIPKAENALMLVTFVAVAPTSVRGTDENNIPHLLPSSKGTDKGRWREGDRKRQVNSPRSGYAKLQIFLLRTSAKLEDGETSQLVVVCACYLYDCYKQQSSDL